MKITNQDIEDKVAMASLEGRSANYVLLDNKTYEDYNAARAIAPTIVLYDSDAAKVSNSEVVDSQFVSDVAVTILRVDTDMDFFEVI